MFVRKLGQYVCLDWGNMFVWKLGKYVCLEIGAICLSGNWGNMFVRKLGQYVCLEIGEICLSESKKLDLEYYDYGEMDPCLMEIPHSHGKTAKKVCGSCDICGTDLCNDGKPKKGGVKPAGAEDEATTRDEAGNLDEGGNTAGIEVPGNTTSL
jgi:hypothetical protein